MLVVVFVMIIFNLIMALEIVGLKRLGEKEAYIGFMIAVPLINLIVYILWRIGWLV